MVCEGGWARQPAGRSSVIEEDAAFGRLLSAEMFRSIGPGEFVGIMRLPGAISMDKGGAIASGLEERLEPTAVAVTIPSPPSNAQGADAVIGQGVRGRAA